MRETEVVFIPNHPMPLRVLDSFSDKIKALEARGFEVTSSHPTYLLMTREKQ